MTVFYFALAIYFIIIFTHGMTRANVKPVVRYIEVTTMSQKAHEVNELYHMTRRSGNTTWILDAAKWKERCIIVCHTDQHADQLRKQYMREMKIRGRFVEWPKFMGRQRALMFARSEGVPVIFDNSALNFQ